MTDNEIIKAVDKCLRADDCHTIECPFFDGNEDSWDCKLVALNFVFDLIKRQKAEIEELTKLLRSRHRVIELLESRIISLPDEVRAESVKEFAEKLKERARAIESATMEAEVEHLLNEMEK